MSTKRIDATTKTTLDLAKTLAKRGFRIPAIEVHTPDGRTWNIATVPGGRGRHADGHWGARPSARGGFRLFEFDYDREVHEEHDAVEGDTWDAGDLVDYLRAVGARRTTNQDKVVDAGGRPGDVPPGYDRSDWNA